MDIPFWMYFVVMGIMISGYMVVKTGKDEKKIEDEIIEQANSRHRRRRLSRIALVRPVAAGRPRRSLRRQLLYGQ